MTRYEKSQNRRDDSIQSPRLLAQMRAHADLRVRLYENTAVVTGLTTTKGKFMPDESYELLVALLSGAVTFVNCLRLAHVFTLFGFAVKA
jgi:hypothetical protein